MSVHVHREAAGVYRAAWQGVVTIEEVITEMKTVTRLADDDDTFEYVLLVDLTQMTRLPFDIGNLRRVALSDDRCRAFIVIKASHGAKLLGQMLDKLTERDFRFVEDVTAGVNMAQAILNEETHPNT